MVLLISHFMDLRLSEVKQVVWGVRRGQQGYFLPPEVSYYCLVLRLWANILANALIFVV